MTDLPQNGVAVRPGKYTFGPWETVIARTSDQLVVVAVELTSPSRTRKRYAEVEVGVGAATEETTTRLRLSFPEVRHRTVYSLLAGVDIPAGVRVATRMRCSASRGLIGVLARLLPSKPWYVRVEVINAM